MTAAGTSECQGFTVLDRQIDDYKDQIKTFMSMIGAAIQK